MFMRNLISPDYSRSENTSALGWVSWLWAASLASGLGGFIKLICHDTAGHFGRARAGF